MDAIFRVFYPIIIETQIDFEGRPHDHEVFCEGHILYHGRLMGKNEDGTPETMEAIMSKSKAKKSKILDKRTTAKMCPACLQAWRECPESPYYRYVNGVPAKVTVVEKPIIGAQA